MIYENVKALCEKKHMSIAELEKKADIGNGTVGKWAKGTKPTIAVLSKIADALGVKITVLLKE